jgi:hypothetical protein
VNWEPMWRLLAAFDKGGFGEWSREEKRRQIV